MKKFIYLLLLLLAFILSLIGYSYGYENKNVWHPVLKQESYGKRTFNIFYIPMWKVQIYKEYNVGFDDVLLMQVIQNLECGREDGMCNNGVDSGPFQFNQIHKIISKQTLQYIKEYNVRGLFIYQFENMLGRISAFNKKCIRYKENNLIDEEFRVLCQLGRHNGSGTYGNYAKKGILIWKELKKDKYKLQKLYEEYDGKEYKEFDYIPFNSVEYTEKVLSLFNK